MTALLVSLALVFSADPQVPGQGAGTGSVGAGQTNQRSMGQAGQQGQQGQQHQGQQGQGNAQSAMKMDGQWRVAYAEINGQQMNLGNNATATMQNNTLTLNENGQQQTFHLNFQGNHQFTLSNNGQGQQGAAGVYIATPQFLCLEVGNFQGGGQNQGSQNAQVGQGNQASNAQGADYDQDRPRRHKHAQANQGGQAANQGQQQGQQMTQQQGQSSFVLILERQQSGQPATR